MSAVAKEQGKGHMPPPPILQLGGNSSISKFTIELVLSNHWVATFSCEPEFFSHVYLCKKRLITLVRFWYPSGMWVT